MKNVLSSLAIISWSLISPVVAQHTFSVGVVAAPTFQYINSEFTSNLPGGDGSTIPVDFHSRVKGYGYTAGVLANYGITKQLSVATGLLLNHVNYRNPTVTTNPDLNTLSLPFDLQLQVLASTISSLQVPLLVNYRTSSKRLSPYLTAGALTTFYSTSSFDGSKRSKNTVEEIRLYPTLAAGIDYRLNEHFSLIIQPTFVYYLPYRKVITYENYQLGLQGQIVYHF